MSTSRQIQLVRRPNGVPVRADFAVVTVETPAAGDGEVQVQNLIMSVDPYMRPRLTADQPLDAPMLGGGLGRVVQSRKPALQGRRPRASRSRHAGAVGSVAAQIAKIKGCYVVGSTGADDKAAWLKDEVGLDAVINYKTQPLAETLAAVTPNGIDVYFENVGGAHLDAALPRMNVRGRIPVCGMIPTYNGGGEGVTNLFALIYGRVRMEGFVSSDFGHLNAAFVADMTGWLKDGRVKYQETILDGFERAPEGLIGLFSGVNTGKMLIRVAE